jgi:nitrogen fixation NifU-like protein
MEDSLDEFVRKMQEMIDEEGQATYGQEVFQRWKNPRFFGRMEDATSFSRIRGKCGDTMEIYLRIRDEVIEAASFVTDGCASSIACGSVAAELAIGKSLDDTVLIGGDTILGVLDGLPELENHCAYLAAEALQTAVHNHIIESIKKK